MTVSQNVSYPLRIRRIERAQRERMVDAALALVDLEGYGRRRPSQLSGGQQQRVALARALVYKPSVLLLDEPLGALDRALRERVQGELRSLHRKVGTTFVHITHDQDEALTMSDRVVVLRDGRIEQVGTPHEIYAQPATQFVASFIGRANLIPAEVVQSRSGTVIVDLASGIRVEVPCDADTSFGPTANIIIRPEKVSPVAEPKAGMCVLVGRLVEETFAGSMWRYAFRAADGSTFHSQTAQRIKGPIGEEVCVEWSPTDAWAIPGLTAPDAAPSP